MTRKICVLLLCCILPCWAINCNQYQADGKVLERLDHLESTNKAIDGNVQTLEQRIEQIESQVHQIQTVNDSLEKAFSLHQKISYLIVNTEANIRTVPYRKHDGDILATAYEGYFLKKLSSVKRPNNRIWYKVEFLFEGQPFEGYVASWLVREERVDLGTYERQNRSAYITYYWENEIVRQLKAHEIASVAIIFEGNKQISNTSQISEFCFNRLLRKLIESKIFPKEIKSFDPRNTTEICKKENVGAIISIAHLNGAHIGLKLFKYDGFMLYVSPELPAPNGKDVEPVVPAVSDPATQLVQ